jgi:hypothetical protein
MGTLITSLVGVIGVVMLIFLPGAWITFGLRVNSISFWARFLIGVVLSPLVIAFQFYTLRLLGFSFQTTAYLLIVLNLPATYLIWRHRIQIVMPKRVTAFGIALVFAIAAVALSPQLFDVQTSAYMGHSWMHADTIYMLANGALIPEEPELAGIRQAYPWAGHIYHGVLSYLNDSPPPADYIWANLLWLLVAWGLTAAIVGELGGNDFAKVTSGIWLFFGLNFLGYPLKLGDYRYTPFLLKYVFYNQMVIGLAMFTAILYLVIKRWPRGFSLSALFLITLLLGGLGIIYPILFPPACAVIGARVIVILLKRNESRTFQFKQVLAIGVVVLVAAALVAAHYRFVFQARIAAEPMQLNLTPNLVRKGLDSIVAPLAFWLGLVLVFRDYWRTRRSALIVLVLGALASSALYIGLIIPVKVEYKFMFPVALCLVPFASLAADKYLSKLGNLALPAFVLISLILMAPYVHKMLTDFPWIPPERPLLDVSGFGLRFDEGEELSSLYDAVRLQTPIETVIAISHTEYNLPTLTSRQMYVPPDDTWYLGVNKSGDHLLLVNRGYGKKILEQRRSTLSWLFDPLEESQREQSLRKLLELDRPIAIILDMDQEADLRDWLHKEDIGRSITQEAGYIVWIVEPEEAKTVVLDH